MSKIINTTIESKMVALNILRMWIISITWELCELVDSFVGSILNYAIEVWGIGTFCYISI